MFIIVSCYVYIFSQFIAFSADLWQKLSVPIEQCLLLNIDHHSYIHDLSSCEIISYLSLLFKYMVFDIFTPISTI